MNFGDLDTHYRWLSLRNRLVDDEAKVYEREFVQVNERGRALSNTLIFGHGLLKALNNLATICGFEIDKRRGVLVGTCYIIHFHQHAAAIERACLEIYDQIYNATNNRYVLHKPTTNTCAKINISPYKSMKKIFDFFGIRVIYHSGRNDRRIIGNERIINSAFSFCELTQNTRMAISDIEYDTGDKAVNGIEYFVAKAPKYF